MSNLESLIGRHFLSGVEITECKIYDPCLSDYANTPCILFTLDNITYRLVEDQDDGYRSYCKELEIANTKPKYRFIPIEVLCKKSEEQYTDILEIIDIQSCKTILQIGTDKTDSYYPYCIFEWKPENMSYEGYIF